MYLVYLAFPGPQAQGFWGLGCISSGITKQPAASSYSEHTWLLGAQYVPFKAASPAQRVRVKQMVPSTVCFPPWLWGPVVT